MQSQEAFKDMAKVLRWRVLANGQHTVREADLILGGESLMKLLGLIWESRRPLTFFVCTAWIALNLVRFPRHALKNYFPNVNQLAQASVAMIGLTYSMDGGTDATTITTRNGMVNVSKIDCYYAENICGNAPDAPPEITQNQAHTYGELTRGQRRCPYRSDEDIYGSPQNCTYFYNNATQEFAYRYAEYNPHDRAKAFPYLTHRIVRASAGNCYQYDFDSSYFIDSNDGKQETFVFLYSNQTYNGSIAIPRPVTAFDSSTYVYNGVLPPQNATVQSCGPRCILLYAFRSYGTITKRKNTFFQCSVTVSNVSNADQDAQKLPDDNARLAAASIAFSYWETQGLTAEEVGSRMSEFAIGSIAAMSVYNPAIQIPGMLPRLGYHLSVEWQYVIALAACIAGVHCLLVALILWISRPIVVTDDSNLAVARLLKGLVDPLGHGGGLLDGEEIAEAVQKEGERVSYGVSEGVEGTILAVGPGLEVRKRLPGRKFPAGQYE
ncbi:MAG: hypothetical protein Q9195_008107 [Heterodermia aff. obscurata]